jgi:hypothetical protein
VPLLLQPCSLSRDNPVRLKADLWRPLTASRETVNVDSLVRGSIMLADIIPHHLSRKKGPFVTFHWRFPIYRIEAYRWAMSHWEVQSVR